jgi:tetratricopeptide (TPR) repeat protein
LDSLVLKQKQTIHRRALIVPYEALYDSAANFFNSGKYKEAVEIYNEILSKKPDLTELLHFRAYSYYHLKEYGKSNQDLNYLISSGASSSGIFNLYSLRGANYYMLGNMDEACKNYKIASDMGDKDGQVNFTRFCKQ